jgi:diacylglycerol kinase family enzyme
VAIANPSAGRRGEVAHAADRLQRLGLVQAVRWAPHLGDADRLTREAATASGLVVLGGDGTVAQVLNAMDRTRQTLAVLPCGHGNCLARDLRVAHMDSALQALHAGHSTCIDLMRVHLSADAEPPGVVWAASTLALGHVADTVLFGRTRLAGLGRAAYAVASVLTPPRDLQAQIEVDPAVLASPRLTGIVVNNTAHLANFRAFHDARLDDGLLDVMLQGHGWPRQLLHNAAILLGSRACGPARLAQARSLTVHLAQPERVMVDGEMSTCIVRVDVSCEAQALRCIAGMARSPG